MRTRARAAATVVFLATCSACSARDHELVTSSAICALGRDADVCALARDLGVDRARQPDLFAYMISAAELATSQARAAQLLARGCSAAAKRIDLRAEPASGPDAGPEPWCTTLERALPSDVPERVHVRYTTACPDAPPIACEPPSDVPPLRLCETTELHVEPAPSTRADDALVLALRDGLPDMAAAHAQFDEAGALRAVLTLHETRARAAADPEGRACLEPSAAQLEPPPASATRDAARRVLALVTRPR